jgi:hypothetical protein
VNTEPNTPLYAATSAQREESQGERRARRAALAVLCGLALVYVAFGAFSMLMATIQIG